MNRVSAFNPFDFKHFIQSKLDVSVNGKTIHNNPFQPTFDNNECLRSYMSLYQGTESFGQNRSIGLQMRDNVDGYTLWGYDLSADQGSEV